MTQKHPTHLCLPHNTAVGSSRRLPMGEQTLLSQIIVAGDASVAAGEPSSSASSPAAAPSTATKIPFRPRKIRKVSPSPTAAEEATPDDHPSKDSYEGGSLVVAAPRVALRVLPRPLSAEGEIAAALRYLREVDAHLAAVIDAHDPPAFQCVHPPFHSLARSILYQQLALKAAGSIYGRFLTLCGSEAGVVPETVLALTPQQLSQIGVSARKASYLHDLARKYHSGILSDAAIVAMDDRSLFSMLTMVKGIGAWSVHMFMIFSLHRPDVLPVGDLGIRKGVQMLYGLEEVPRPSQMEQLCERWRPYRSVGAWYMWRLVESRNNPNLVSPVAVSVTDGAGRVEAIQQQRQQQQQQQQQEEEKSATLLIDAIQMSPNT